MLNSGLRSESWGWLLFTCFLVGGCRSSVSPLGPTDGPGKPAAAPAGGASEAASTRAVSRSAAGAIPESVLNEHGMTTLWTKQPAKAEGAIRNVYLLPEGLFAVTRPDPDVRSWRLIRYDLETGLPSWFYELEEPLEHAPVAYHYGTSASGQRPDELYLLQKDVLRCLDLQYGADMWRVRLRFPVSSAPVVDDNQLYVGSYDRRIYAMPKKTGLDSWTYITGGEITSAGTVGEGGHLYFTSTDKYVYRLEPASGWVNGKSWRFATGARILGSPVFFSRWIFVGSTDFKLYCFEMDGTRAWEFPAEASVSETPVVMSLKPDKPMVFCISQESRGGREKRIAWALDAKTGQTYWHRDDVSQVIGIGRRAVYLLPDTRAVQGGRQLIAVDAMKGDELFSIPVDRFEIIPTNDAEHGTNARTRGVVYLVSKAGLVQAIREKP